MTKAILLLLAAVALGGGCALSTEVSLRRAYHAMESGNYEAALSRLSAAERYAGASSELKAEIAFLRAKSYEGLQDVPEAVGLYRYLVAAFPDSPYAWAAREKLQMFETRQAQSQRAFMRW
jgi:outer membrane protein assembly factor BamD (BamD/ComL family)